jgi:hypothetical protein
VWQSRDTHSARELRETIRAIERNLHRLEIPYEEWDVLFRELLLLQRALSSHPMAESSDASEDHDRIPFAHGIQVPALSAGTRFVVAAAAICVLVVTYLVRRSFALAQIRI